MNSRLVFAAALTLILLPVSALALDAGTVKGSLKAGGKDIPLRHSIAYQLDNAEGLLDSPNELRIVLSDREVPQDVLAGLAFPPVMDLAREGKMQGLMLRLDPADKKKVVVTLLAAPSDPRMSLTNLTLGGSQDAFRKLDVANNRVIGEIAHKESRTGSADMPSLDFALQFSSPLFSQPAVSADLKGEAARKSPQAQILREKARALSKGDFDALKKLSTARQNQRTDMFIAQAGAQAKTHARQAAMAIEQSLKTLDRVVVRGDTAVAIVGKGEWMNFVREGGQWKTDD